MPVHIPFISRQIVGSIAESASSGDIPIRANVRYRTEHGAVVVSAATQVWSNGMADMMRDLGASQQNNLLAAMPLQERGRLEPYLKLVPMQLGRVVYEAGGSQRYAYFPTDCIVSLLYVMKDGASAEISVVGNDGIVGVALFMGGETTPSRAVVQSAGSAYRLLGRRLKEEFYRHGKTQLLLLRYTQALLTQMAQTAVCNRHHGVEQQLCRWLLLSLDRLPSNQLNMTQELIANMLGVRREGVAAAAARLQRIGAIRYSRGRLMVLDRPKLEELCCECYAVVKQETDRLLPRPFAVR